MEFEKSRARSTKSRRMPGNRLKSAAQINWLRRQTSSQFSSETKMRSRIFAIPSYPTLTPALAPTFPHLCGAEGCGSLIAPTGKSHVRAGTHIKTPPHPARLPSTQPPANPLRDRPENLRMTPTLAHGQRCPQNLPKPRQPTCPALLLSIRGGREALKFYENQPPRSTTA